jgi:hypothetical protein
MVMDVTLLIEPRDEPTILSISHSFGSMDHSLLPRAVHEAPFQTEKKVELSPDLPATKILLTFPPLTSSAVTGPGSPDPTGNQVLFSKEKLTTFACELSGRASAPAATRMSCLSYPVKSTPLSPQPRLI